MELPPDDMQKLLVHNTVSIINIKIARWLNEVSNFCLPKINYVLGVVWSGLTGWQRSRLQDYKGRCRKEMTCLCLQGTDLKAQMFLLGTGTDLYQEALDTGRLTEDLNMKVGYSDIFISPWCCDSSHEDRYEKLIGKIFIVFSSYCLYLLMQLDRRNVQAGDGLHYCGPSERDESLLHRVRSASLLCQ